MAEAKDVLGTERRLEQETKETKETKEEKESGFDETPENGKMSTPLMVAIIVFSVFIAIVLALSIAGLVRADNAVSQSQQALDTVQGANQAAIQASQKADAAAATAAGNPAIDGGLNSSAPSLTYLLTSPNGQTQAWTSTTSVGGDISLWSIVTLTDTGGLLSCPDGINITINKPGWYNFQPTLPLSFNSATMASAWLWYMTPSGGGSKTRMGGLNFTNNYPPASGQTVAFTLTGDTGFYVPAGAVLQLRGSFKGAGTTTLSSGPIAGGDVLNVLITKFS
jgi:hypothetical protein